MSEVKDSGSRRTAVTGAVRDVPAGKGRFDLLPYFGLLRIAQQMEAGANKYAARNWEKGMPLSWFADSALRHLTKLIAGFDDEPHLSAVIWNVMCYAETEERIKRGLLPAELDDMPHTYAGQDPDDSKPREKSLIDRTVEVLEKIPTKSTPVNLDACKPDALAVANIITSVAKVDPTVPATDGLGNPILPIVSLKTIDIPQ